MHAYIQFFGPGKLSPTMMQHSLSSRVFNVVYKHKLYAQNEIKVRFSNAVYKILVYTSFGQNGHVIG